MDQESITRGILNSIVDHYLSEIAADPKRSIRKLVDMAERTSDGPTQKICYQMMQRMAGNQSSPYYEMIYHLVTHTDPQTIKQFGINLGHNAWTFGSGRIRRLNEKGDSPIPWTILIDRTPDPQRIEFDEIAGQIERGHAHEIYAWMIITGGVPDEWAEYGPLFRRYADSVFALFIDPDCISEKFAEEASAFHNLMIVVNTDRPGWRDAIAILEQKKCLISACKTVSGAEDAEDVLSGKWMEELTPCHPIMAFTVTSDDCPEDTAAAVSRYMWNTRLNQVYPLLPVNLISDCLIISRMVSHREAFYRIEPDGQVRTAKGHYFQR